MKSVIEQSVNPADLIESRVNSLPGGRENLEEFAGKILRIIGENPERQGLKETPRRFANALTFLTSGYLINTQKLVGSAIFDGPSGELVLIKDIEFYSLCEHHLLPFFGKAHVAYIPDGRVIGLSKIPRIVDAFARRLQVQERLTQEIAEEIERILNPKGVAVIIEASHLCMMMRGVSKQNSVTTTSAFFGEFEKNETRSEFLKLISAKLH